MYSDEYQERPFSAPAEPRSGSDWATRHYRQRLYRDLSGVYLKVSDSLEIPFEAPEFPRGELLFEAVSLTDSDARDQLLCWMHRKDLNPRGGDVDILQAPATVYRCRLYRLESGRFTELWDSIPEPFEYRGEMPIGEVVAVEADFSKRFLRSRMNEHRHRLGVVVASSWVKTLGW